MDTDCVTPLVLMTPTVRTDELPTIVSGNASVDVVNVKAPIAEAAGAGRMAAPPTTSSKAKTREITTRVTRTTSTGRATTGDQLTVRGE